MSTCSFFFAPGEIGRYDKCIADRLNRSSDYTRKTGTNRPLRSKGISPRSRDTRRQILEAADRALRSKGLLGASTREIAREAGVADGTIYVHFADRIDLFLALIQEHLPIFVDPLKRLQTRIGKRTVEANLSDVLDASFAWHTRMRPVFGALAADPALLDALRERLIQRNEGPHLAVRCVEAYLNQEKQLGRVNAGISAAAVAIALFGASHYWSSVLDRLGNTLGYSRKTLIREVIDSLTCGLEPKLAMRKQQRRK